MAPLFGILLVLSALAVVLVILRLWQVRRHPASECTRKALHVAMSAVVLALPWLFAATWPVLMLAGLSLAAMGGLRTVRGLREGVGRVLYSVKRSSLGELCFPVAVCALFVLADGRLLLYAAPVLVMGLADPAAALAGQRWGRAAYSSSRGAKTAEGSLVFCGVATGLVFACLLLTDACAPGAALTLGLFVALPATLAEAVATRGLDNLLVPLVAFAALEPALSMEAAVLHARLLTIASSGSLALGICLLHPPSFPTSLRRFPAPARLPSV